MPSAPRTPVLAATAAVLAAALTAVLVVASLTGPAAARTLPSKATWSAAVRTAMDGSQDYLTTRAGSAGMARLAINLDIDNTSLQTTYARGRAVRPVLAFAQRADALGIAVFFNTGRTSAKAVGVASRLQAVGFPLDGLCTRVTGETLPQSKQRCRASFVAQGYTIVANVGNNPTDFVGGNYERAFRLPNYGGQLS